MYVVEQEFVIIILYMLKATQNQVKLPVEPGQCYNLL